MRPRSQIGERTQAWLRAFGRTVVSPRFWFWLAVVAAAAAVWLVSAEVIARPGGGQGYTGPSTPSGGSGSGSGSRGSGSGSGSYGSGSSGSGSSGSTTNSGSDGGDGGIGELIAYLLIELVLREPRIGIPLVLAVIGVIVVHRTWGALSEWTEGKTMEWIQAAADAPPDEEPRGKNGRGAATTAQRSPIRRIATIDPEFSAVIFEDFAQALYARVHEARGARALDSLAAYVTEAVRASLRERGSPAAVQGVVIGAMSVTSVAGITDGAERVDVVLRFESNLTEISDDAVERGLYLVESWTLSRDRSAMSRPPARARTFDCPSCGAPLTSRDENTNRCRSCSQLLTPGAFDWALTRVFVERQNEVPPAVGGHAEERGTDLGTVVTEDARERLNALCNRDPSFAWEHFEERVRTAFREINEGFSELRWERARPFVTDPFFQTQRYWIQAYERAKRRNVVEHGMISELELADARSDRYYDAICVRVFANGLDYTLDVTTDDVVSGSTNERRSWSEYWTFVRSVARATPTEGAARSEKQCPSCGGALDIEMSGACRYCNVHVTSGEFDWVLSRIEQDDAYRG